jgi:hypothetical protein
LTGFNLPNVIHARQYANLRCLAVAFLLFQDRVTVTERKRASRVRTDEDPDFSRIRCPLCKWQPKPSHRWFCAPCGYPEFFDDGCGACWNTFTTRGLCPGCGHQWRWTSCLNCSGWSLHEDWYKSDTKK